MKDIKDEALLPWLEGFVETVGEQEARRLLQDVGNLDADNLL